MNRKHVVKSILSVMLTMAMIFGTVQLPFAPESVVVHAEPSVVASGNCGDNGDNVKWSLDNTYKLTISGSGAMADFANTSNVPWYAYYSAITSVVIENGVTSIGSKAFWDCKGLTSITIPGSVTSIGAEAFLRCEKLTGIFIPKNVSSIGTNAFGFCKLLSAITVDENNSTYASDDGVLFNKDKTMLIRYPENKPGDSYSYSIPNTVTSIGNHAFGECSGLTTITIPDSVTSIGEYAFVLCENLIKITIPNSVKSIGDSAFNGCSGLTTVDIPNSVTSIGEDAFYGCSVLTTVTIPDSVTSIGDSAFYKCAGLTTITIPDSVTSIGNKAFYDCSGLTTITIPDSVTSIGDRAFENCSGLTTITITDGVTSIGIFAFVKCSELTTITIPNSVTSIGERAFEYCSDLQTVYAPSGLDLSNCLIQQEATITQYYAAKLASTEHGTVTVSGGDVPGNGAYFINGGTATLTITPDEGCIVREVKYNDGEDHIITPDNNNAYIFTMPSDRHVTVTAKFLKISQIPDANSNLIYNGKEQTGVVSGEGYTVTGNTAINAGAYKAKATLNDGYIWSGGTTEDKEIEWSIAKATPSYEAPTGLKATTGQLLSNVALPEGWTWADKTLSVGNAGTNVFKATYTPADTTNYMVVENVELSVVVSKATSNTSGGSTSLGGGSSAPSGSGSTGSTDNKDTIEKTTTPVTEKTTNADGSVTEKTTTTNTDGSKTETSKTTAKDGTITEAEKTTAKDGTVKETEKTTATDGTITETEKTTSTDGSVKEIEKTTTTDGTIVEKTAETDKDGSSKVSEKVTEKDGSSSETTVTVDSNGKAKSIVASESDGKKDSQTVAFDVKGNKATVSSIDTSTGKVTIPETIEAPDGKTYTVTKLDKDAFDGQKLKELSLPETIKVINPKALENTGLKTLNLTGKNTKLKKNCLKNTNKNLVIKVTTKAEKRNIEKQLKKAGNPKAKVKVTKKSQ